MSLIKRRTIAIVSAILAIIILAIACSAVLKYTRTLEYTDVDGTVYHILNKDGEYKLYDKGADTHRPIDEQYKYFVTNAGTLVKIDPQTGEVKDVIMVDNINQFIGSEQIGASARVLIFPRLVRDDILSIEVKNPSGSFTFIRYNDKLEIDPKGDFVIKESPLTEFSGEKFAELIVGTGYSISTMKIKDPIKDANGEYTEYGLVPAVRERKKVDEKTGKVVLDEDKNPIMETYNYEPSYYIVTEISGKKHKMIVGDEIIPGGGYYVQYVDMTENGEVKRDAVYILGSTTGNSVMSTIENYISPVITYPLSMANYYDVEKFIINQKKEDALSNNFADLYKTIISFSYIDMDKRENSTAAVVPYMFSFGLEGYGASDIAINNSLYKLYSPEIIGAVKAFPDDDDLIEYGFFTPRLDENGAPILDEKGNVKVDISAKYTINYYYDILNENNDGVDRVIYQTVLVSDRDYEETGNYYTYSMYEITQEGDKKIDAPKVCIYDYVVEVNGTTLDFLAWDEYDWVNPSYIDQNIAFVTDINIISSGYSAEFKLDNSMSSQKNGISSTLMFINGKASDGKISSSIGVLEVVDERGIRWGITPTSIMMRDASGNSTSDKQNTFYDYNKMGAQVLCWNSNSPIGSFSRIKKIFHNGEEIENSAGATVNVTANNVFIQLSTGETISYLRYETELFRQFYETLLFSKLVDSYELTDEEEQALIKDSSKHLLTIKMTIKDSDKSVKNEETGKVEVVPGETTTNVYSFYKLSARKAYITVNGRGGFYVYSSRLEKIINDAMRYFNGQNIDPLGSR